MIYAGFLFWSQTISTCDEWVRPQVSVVTAPGSLVRRNSALQRSRGAGWGTRPPKTRDVTPVLYSATKRRPVTEMKATRRSEAALGAILAQYKPTNDAWAALPVNSGSGAGYCRPGGFGCTRVLGRFRTQRRFPGTYARALSAWFRWRQRPPQGAATNARHPPNATTNTQLHF
jgi:hypothetical protein